MRVDRLEFLIADVWRVLINTNHTVGRAKTNERISKIELQILIISDRG